MKKRTKSAKRPAQKGATHSPALHRSGFFRLIFAGGVTPRVVAADSQAEAESFGRNLSASFTRAEPVFDR
jgi:hypothetical protein